MKPLIRNLSSALASFSMLFILSSSSCDEDKVETGIIDDTSLSCQVEYDFRLPSPLMEIADAYVEYTDNGKKGTELMKNGRWTKSFSYKWEGDGISNNDYDISTLKITLKPKVSTDQLNNGAELFKDPNASFSSRVTYTYDRKQASSSSSSSGSTSSSSGYSKTDSDGNTFHIESNYGYSIADQMKLFDDQDIFPFWESKCDHVGTRCKMTNYWNFGPANQSSY